MLENEKQKDPGDIKNFDPSEDLNMFFENFIQMGVVTKEREVVPGFKIKIKVLDTGEILTAESVLQMSNPNIPFDVMEKVRAASILSQSILSINGVPVEKEDYTKEQNAMRRSALYSQLLKMPPIAVQKSYELYIDAVKEQNNFYVNSEETKGKIQNF